MSKEIIKISKQIDKEEFEKIKNGSFKDIFEFLFNGSEENKDE